MTKVRYRPRPVWHETRADWDGRTLVVRETPSNVLIRRKGTRQVLSLPWRFIFLQKAAKTRQACRRRSDQPSNT